jgi:hypothetical protein
MEVPMKSRTAILTVVSVLVSVFLAGCSEPRYQVFTLHKEVVDENRDRQDGKTGTYTDTTRNVLVDRQTGKMYYFIENGGPLHAFPE